MSPSFALSGDGVSQGLLESLAEKCGCPLVPAEDGEVLADQPLVMVVSQLDDDRLARALRPPVAVCLEAGDGMPDPASLPLGGLYMSLTTVTAYGMEPAHAFCDALAQRTGLPEEKQQMMELALHEALVNAMVHGNLEIGAITKDSLDDFIQFCQLIETRLSEGTFSGRRVVMAADWSGETVDVVIEDQGPGYNLAVLDEPIDLGKKSGRGLFLIRDVARDISIENGGRRLIMRFER